MNPVQGRPKFCLASSATVAGAYSSYIAAMIRIHWPGARESFVTLVWYRFGVPLFNGVYWQAWYGWVTVTGNRLKGLGFLTFRFDLCSFFTNLRLCSLPIELVALIDQWTLFDGVKWFWRCLRCLFVLYGLYSRSLKCHPPSLRLTAADFRD